MTRREEIARVRHKKRGSTYEVIGYASVQTTEPIHEGDVVMVYVGKDGDRWARPAHEFNDGRFESLPPQEPVTSELFRTTPGGSLEVLYNDVWTSVPPPAASALSLQEAKIAWLNTALDAAHKAADWNMGVVAERDGEIARLRAEVEQDGDALFDLKARAETAEQARDEALKAFEPFFEAYKAFQGAFDTPLSRRKQPDEYAADARNRMNSFNDTAREVYTRLVKGS